MRHRGAISSFLLDVSGSMASSERLPLVKTAMRLLVDTLTARDRVAIVVYAGASGLVLPSTPGDRKAEIQRALAELDAAESTNGAEGIRLAYDAAAAAFVRDSVNRVILATDGDFNVGVTSQGELVRLIETQRARGIFLSVLGVGTDNLKDSTMEKLADRGNGNYAYLDSLHEARRVLIEEAGSTFVTVAKDAKIQVEFNPPSSRRVSAGRVREPAAESRGLQRRHEGCWRDRRRTQRDGALRVDSSRRANPDGSRRSAHLSGDSKARRVGGRRRAHDSQAAIQEAGRRVQSADVAAGSGCPRRSDADIGFAAAVAQFGMLLRSSEFKEQATWSSTRKLAREHGGEDPNGYRAEFVRLVDLAATLATESTTSTSTRRNRQ